MLGAPMYRWRDFTALTRTGVIGDARHATAGKGEKLINGCGAGARGHGQRSGAVGVSTAVGTGCRPGAPGTPHPADIASPDNDRKQP